jgi:mono/diheme cytochrome c family protein
MRSIFRKMTFSRITAMNTIARKTILPRILTVAVITLSSISLSRAVDEKFHNAPESAKTMKNPYEGQQPAAQAGRRLFAKNCLSCHGKTGEGTGNVPSLVDGKLEAATSGEVFWFITRGSKSNGMPAWGFLPAQQRWQIVTYVKSLGMSQTAAQSMPDTPAEEVAGTTVKAPPPPRPVTDFR